MSDNLVSPEQQLVIGDQTYVLDGTFQTLKAIQHAFGQDILVVQARILDMRQDEITRLIAAASGKDEDVIGQAILDQMDLAGTDYMLLKGGLLTWLALAMTPRRDREKKALALAETLERFKASRGETTRSSASASSGGTRRRSGKAPSGT